MTGVHLAPVRSTRVEFNVADGAPDVLGYIAPAASEPGRDHGLDDRRRDQEFVRLENHDLARRVQRLSTDRGREVSLRLPSGSPALRPGDVIAVTDTSLIVVEPVTTSAIIVRSESLRQMGEVAHGLGNRHRQVQFFDADSQFGQVVFLTPYDHTVVDYLTGADCPFTVEDVTLAEPFRHAEHTH